MKGGAVQSVGQSRLRCDPAVCDFSDPRIREGVSVHAEVDAIRRCGNPKGATLYIARIGRSGQVALAKPCKRCRKVIKEVGIKRVIYTVDYENCWMWNPRR